MSTSMSRIIENLRSDSPSDSLQYVDTDTNTIIKVYNPPSSLPNYNKISRLVVNDANHYFSTPNQVASYLEQNYAEL